MSGPRLPSVRERPAPPMGLYEVVGLGAAIAILLVFRLHAFDLPLETDECNYAVIASRLLAGDRLYVDVWDHQPFGVFALFATVITVFGDTPHVFRWMAMLFSGTSLLLIFAILRNSAGRGAAVLGAILFALASSDPGTGGEGCNREIYMNTLILTAWYCALRSSTRTSFWLFTSGAALGIASSLKTIVAVHWVFLAVWIVVSESRKGSGPRRQAMVARRLLWFTSGPAILWGAASAYFTATGRFGEFIDAVFMFNLGYSDSSEPFLMRFVRFFAPIRHPFIFGSAIPLWIGAIIGSIWLIFEQVVQRSRIARVTTPLPLRGRGQGEGDSGRGMSSLAIVILLLASYLAICLPGRFWPHYYYLLIPASVLAVSTVMQRWAMWLQHGLFLGKRGADGARILVYTLVPIALAVTEVRGYLLQPPFGITVQRYNSRDFWGEAQGRNVAAVTELDDRVFVFGNDASIYFYSHRRCASRYTMITGLAAGMRGADERRGTLMTELTANPPRLIVVLFDQKPFDEWLRFLEQYYGEAVGVDYHDRTGDPIMLVFVRKDRRIRAIDWDWDRSAVGGWQLGERR